MLLGHVHFRFVGALVHFIVRPPSPDVARTTLHDCADATRDSRTAATIEATVSHGTIFMATAVAEVGIADR